MTPYEAYCDYLALKNHFTSEKYDYFKYEGKVTAKFETFDKRRDKYQFYKLSKKKDVTGYLVSNFIHNHKLWIGDLNSTKCEEIYAKWKKNQESLSYVFKNDLEKMDDDFNKNLAVVDGNYPHLLKLFQFDEISMETLVILNKLVNFIPQWDATINDTIIWPDIKNRLKKYESFVKFDEKKFREIALKRFSEA